MIELAPIDRVEGVVRVPGDKSIGHRAVLFAALSNGTSAIRGLPSGGDVATTIQCVQALGARVDRAADEVRIQGRGWEGFDHEHAVLDCGNSGTTTRLLMGVLAGRRGRYSLSGDESLSRRPMGRVIRPLSRLGAEVYARSATPAPGAMPDRLPLEIVGRPLHGAEIETGVASAQVKSAAILAALQAEGDSVITEPAPTRDHTERMLIARGAWLERAKGNKVKVLGGAWPLEPVPVDVPGDPSSAAFLVAAAAARPGSYLRVEGVCLNPRRMGFYRLLQCMGADVRWEASEVEPEPVGTIEVRGSELRGIEISGEDVVDAIDELPVLAVLAALAEGTTQLKGAGELRFKESDRIGSTADLLKAFGAKCQELPDGFVITGRPGRLTGARFDAGVDHRIAMAAAVAAACSSGPSVVLGDEWAAISYPTFFADLLAIRR